MRFSIYDLILICLGLSYGTYEIFIKPVHRYSFDIAGILSYVLAVWIFLSCVKSETDQYRRDVIQKHGNRK